MSRTVAARRVLVVPDSRAFAETAAGELVRAAASSKGPFRVALSGGKTPTDAYALLADVDEPYRARLPWGRLRFFWGDERCVPPDSRESNYRLAHEAMLSRVALSPGQVHRVPTELGPEEAARRYEETVRREFGPHPRFEWIFLGIGDNGHTASLFPRDPALREDRRLVVGVPDRDGRLPRVTFTLPLINAAQRVVFLVSGAAKGEAARRALEDGPSEDCPASLVQPDGVLDWILDREAAARLAPILKG